MGGYFFSKTDCKWADMDGALHKSITLSQYLSLAAKLYRVSRVIISAACGI